MTINDGLLVFLATITIAVIGWVMKVVSDNNKDHNKIYDKIEDEIKKVNEDNNNKHGLIHEKINKMQTEHIERLARLETKLNGKIH